MIVSERQKIKTFAAEMQKKADDTIEDETVCKAGCAHCCNQYAMAFDFEVPLIQDYRRDNNIIVNNHEWGKEFAKDPDGLLAGKTPSKETFKAKCPYLDKEGQCMIYEVRPIICRLHVQFKAVRLCKKNHARPSGNLKAFSFHQKIMKDFKVNHIPIGFI